MTSLFIILFMFIHNSSLKNGRKTCSRIASAQAVFANFCNFDFQLSPDKFQYEDS